MFGKIVAIMDVRTSNDVLGLRYEVNRKIWWASPADFKFPLTQKDRELVLANESPIAQKLIERLENINGVSKCVLSPYLLIVDYPYAGIENTDKEVRGILTELLPLCYKEEEVDAGVRFSETSNDCDDEDVDWR